MIAHEVNQHGPQVVAEPSTITIGAMERTLDKTQGKLLEQFVGNIRIAGGAEQISIHGALVSPDQGCPMILFARLRILFLQERPDGRNPAQPRAELLFVHTCIPPRGLPGSGSANSIVGVLVSLQWGCVRE